MNHEKLQKTFNMVGRKYALDILSMFDNDLSKGFKFNEFKLNFPNSTSRAISICLKELIRQEYIQKISNGKNTRMVYILTKKGVVLYQSVKKMEKYFTDNLENIK